MWPNPPFKFTEEILSGKLYFLCNDIKKFSVKDFFNKCEQIRDFPQICTVWKVSKYGSEKATCLDTFNAVLFIFPKGILKESFFV